MTKSDNMVFSTSELVVERIWKYLTRKLQNAVTEFNG